MSLQLFCTIEWTSELMYNSENVLDQKKQRTEAWQKYHYQYLQYSHYYLKKRLHLLLHLNQYSFHLN